jgi:deoxyribonuclease V
MPPLTHRWPTTVAQARALQERLRGHVVRTDRLPRVRYIAGVDVGYEADGEITRAAIAILSFPDLRLREYAIARRRTRFPYVPGYLGFREIPAVLEALKRLHIRPDLLVCDAQGYAHPRRCGLASHLGLVTGLPSIGAAKSRLVGHHAPVPGRRGCWRPLLEDGEVVGAALRTRTGVKPVYVSIGHRISLPTAIAYVLRLTPTYRLPETTRAAHALASHGEPLRMNSPTGRHSAGSPRGA